VAGTSEVAEEVVAGVVVAVVAAEVVVAAVGPEVLRVSRLLELVEEEAAVMVVAVVVLAVRAEVVWPRSDFSEEFISLGHIPDLCFLFAGSSSEITCWSGLGSLSCLRRLRCFFSKAHLCCKEVATVTIESSILRTASVSRLPSDSLSNGCKIQAVADEVCRRREFLTPHARAKSFC
jgi:hypothetical protein